MARRKVVLAEGEIYHIFNRGVEKRDIFLDKRDYQRFISTFVYYQYQKPPIRYSYRQRQKLPQKTPLEETGKLIEIYAYCLMPNHFHFLLKQTSKNGISKFVGQISNSYARYFNARHDRIGSLFQGKFKAVRVTSNEQLIHLSRYIHLNPIINYLVKDLSQYYYSSYPEYLGLKKVVCSPDEVLGQFNTKDDYEKFVLDQEEYTRELKKIERERID